MVGRWEGGRQWRKKNLRLKGNLKQINFGNQEFPVRKTKTSPVPESTTSPRAPAHYQGWLLYNSADPVPTPTSLTDPREGQKAAGEGLALSSSDGSLLGPRKPTVGNTHP